MVQSATNRARAGAKFLAAAPQPQLPAVAGANPMVYGGAAPGTVPVMAGTVGGGCCGGALTAIPAARRAVYAAALVAALAQLALFCAAAGVPWYGASTSGSGFGGDADSGFAISLTRSWLCIDGSCYSSSYFDSSMRAGLAFIVRSMGGSLLCAAPCCAALPCSALCRSALRGAVPRVRPRPLHAPRSLRRPPNLWPSHARCS